MSKKHVYRPFDKVRILRPRWVHRVGYAIIWTDLMQEVEADPRTHAALAALGVVNPSDELLQGIAKHRVIERKFGGNARTIHYRKVSKVNDGLEALLDDDVPAHGYVGQVATVFSKRVVKTGIRSPARGYGEDWEPGYLGDESTHVLLRTSFGEIEVCDVEPA